MGRLSVIELRPYQEAIRQDIHGAWNAGARNVMAVLPTGGGKTVNMAREFADNVGASIGIAHRQELVGQMSLALARNSVRHRIIGSPDLMRAIVQIHMAEVGRSFFDPSAACGVAGVDTLVRRDPLPWFQQVTLWQEDEGHHALRENKWGEAALLFPNARGILWTATPGRADGKGLGRAADGIADTMVTGPNMRELIAAGYLTDYRVFCPPNDVDLSNVNTTASGDYSPTKVREAVHKSHIVGDVVQHYLCIARGKLGVTFAVDVEHAKEITLAYRAAGVPSEIVTSDTPDVLRAVVLRRFRNREILQLVNVDLFGEGFDLPAIEVVSMARPTASFTLYTQQFGRALRLLPGKLFGIIIDHVGNVHRHGLPDRPRDWSLDRRQGARRNLGTESIPTTTCPECLGAYERIFRACPYCSYVKEPAGRARAEDVDGDLIELDAAALADMRNAITRIDGPARPPMHLDHAARKHVEIHHAARQRAQAVLRETMILWASWQQQLGRDMHEIYRRFYFAFGVDFMTAQALNTKDAETLNTTIAAVLSAAGVVAVPL